MHWRQTHAALGRRPANPKLETLIAFIAAFIVSGFGLGVLAFLFHVAGHS